MGLAQDIQHLIHTFPTEALAAYVIGAFAFKFVVLGVPWDAPVTSWSTWSTIAVRTALTLCTLPMLRSTRWDVHGIPPHICAALRCPRQASPSFCLSMVGRCSQPACYWLSGRCHASDMLFVPLQSVIIYHFDFIYGRALAVYCYYFCGVVTAFVAGSSHPNLAYVWLTVSVARRHPLLPSHHVRMFAFPCISEPGAVETRQAEVQGAPLAATLVCMVCLMACSE